MSRIGTALMVCGALLAAPAFGASPDPKDLGVPPAELSKARELVRRLGSEAYREREEAQAELTKMGRIARQALVEGATTDADPEIRLRCTRLIPKATADELKARIDTFLADTDCKYDHDLPGLKAFSKALGTTPKVRELYAEILKSPSNLDMLVAIDKGEVEGGRVISDRRTAMWNDMQHRQVVPGGKAVVPKMPTATDLAALMFAETLVSSDHIPKNGVWMWVNTPVILQHQPPLLNALNNASSPHVDAYKVIVGQWLATRTDANELTNLSHMLVNNGALSKFKETLPLLRRIVLADGVQGYAKGQALAGIIQLRGKEEAPFLKTLMNNDTLVQQVWFQKGNGQAEMHNCLMKDMALAYTISQAGGNIKDYGFETPPNVNINVTTPTLGLYAFTSDEKRAAGFMKYGWKQLKDGIDGPASKEAPKDGPKPAVAPPPTGK